MSRGQCTTQQKAKCVCWFEELKSETMVQRRYRQEFGDGAHEYCPSRMSINRWHEKFFETGSILRGPTDRTKSVRTEEMESEVVRGFEKDPHMSLRQAASMFSVSKNSISRTLRNYGFHPYRMQTVQQLSEEDKEDRMTFARDELERIEDDPDHLPNLLFFR